MEPKFLKHEQPMIDDESGATRKQRQQKMIFAFSESGNMVPGTLSPN